MGKLNVVVLRYLSRDDFRVLTAVSSKLAKSLTAKLARVRPVVSGLAFLQKRLRCCTRAIASDTLVSNFLTD